MITKSSISYLLIVFATTAASHAGEVKLTTYYPAPYGEYKELRSKSKTYLATDTTDPNAKVGIGTTAPGDKLHIVNPTQAVGDAQVILEGVKAGYGAGISFQSRLNGGGDPLKEMARITADGENPWDATVSNQDAGLRFYTTQDGGTSEKVRINNAGNVGIGTTSPVAKLDARDPNGDSGVKIAQFLSPLTALGNTNYIKVGKTNTADGATFGYQYHSASSMAGAFVGDYNGNIQLFVRGNGNVGIGTTTPKRPLHVNIKGSTGGNGDVAFITFADVDHAAPRGSDIQFAFVDEEGTITSRPMKIDINGNVGIGTTAPQAKLDVNGKIRGTATYGYDESTNPAPSTTSRSSTWASGFYTTISVQDNDLVMVLLTANLSNTDGTTYMMAGLYSGNATAILSPNWITCTGSSKTDWDGGASVGIYKATTDGTLRFQGKWHVSDSTGYHVYGNIVAWVIGKAG